MSRKYKTEAAVVLVSLALVLVLCLGNNAAVALFDQRKAVQIDPSAIEDSTLVIGTHLIYLHSLNEEIYEIAVQSASNSGQDRRYYKSELAGGIWMDITEAGTINDISAGGIVASENEIASLYMTHHTKSDGITYDLQTGQPICIYDIVNVYDLENMPELEALKLQYDKLRESGSERKTDKRNIGLIGDFFATEVHTDNTQQYDWQIQMLQRYYEELSANGADSKYLETALAVMEKVSNARKVQVFAIVSDALEVLQDNVANAADDDNELQIDDALLTSIADSQYALGESRAEAEGNMLSAQDSVVSEKEYGLCIDMISNAESSNFFGCDEQNLQLQYLGNINNGRIVDAAQELKLLEELTDSADGRYSAELSEGMTPEYQVLVSRNVSHAALENRMDEDVTGAAAARGELEFLIQGTVDRMESIGELAGKGTQEYILQKIQDAAKFKLAVKQDDYAEKYQSSVTEYVQWLASLLSGIKSTGSDPSEEEILYEQKAELQEQKLKALDALDLDTAKRIDAKIADIDEKIGTLETAQSEKLEELTTRKSELEAQLSQNPQDMEIQMEISSLEVQIAALSGIKSTGGDSNEEEILYEQKAELQEQKLKALDALDLDTAKQIDAKIADVDEKIGALEMAQTKKLEELTTRKSELEAQLSQNPQDMGIQMEISSLEAQIAAGQSTLSGSSQAANIMESKNAIISLLADGNTGDAAIGQLADNVDLLAAMLADGSPLALAAMKEVYAKMLAKSELGDVSAYDDILDQIETAVSESTVSARLTDELSPELAEDIVAEALGVGGLLNADGSIALESLAVIPQDDLLAALLALSECNKEANTDSAMKAFVQGLAATLEQSSDLSVFQTQQQQDEPYVPAEMLAKYLGYRYVWNETRKNAILSKGRIYYSFTAYDDHVVTEKDETLSMDKPAVFSRQLLIPGSFVQKQFGCYVYDIAGTDYSVLVNDRVVERSQEILSELLRSS